MLEYATAFTTTPSLIISDYRLRNGEDGILAIERLRSEFNSDIPAILITGDTAPDRIRDAVISDCFLMHKPVSDNRLRASIAKLTAEVPGRL
jgi:CheY-like chemotaxis protein